MNDAARNAVTPADTPQPLEPKVYQHVLSAIPEAERALLDAIAVELDTRGYSGITATQALLLYRLDKLTLTPTSLQRDGYYFGTNVAYTVKKLTEAGYITQQPSPIDGRSKLIHNTDTGREICTVVKDMILLSASTIAKTGISAVDMQTTLCTLQRLRAHLKNHKRLP